MPNLLCLLLPALDLGALTRDVSRLLAIEANDAGARAITAKMAFLTAIVAAHATFAITTTIVAAAGSGTRVTATVIRAVTAIVAIIGAVTAVVAIIGAITATTTVRAVAPTGIGTAASACSATTSLYIATFGAASLASAVASKIVEVAIIALPVTRAELRHS